MSKKAVAVVIAACLLTAALTPIVQSQEQAPQPSTEEMAEMMKHFEKLSQPGEAHKKMNHFVGEWNVVSKMWTGGPGAPPVETKATASTKWILDGRYIEETYHGTFMGKPFEGRGTMGFDNYKNIYVHTWLDSMSTGMFMSKGRLDASGAAMYLYGEMDEPMENVQDQMSKIVVRIINENKHVTEMYDLFSSEESKIMELVYTRK